MRALVGCVSRRAVQRRLFGMVGQLDCPGGAARIQSKISFGGQPGMESTDSAPFTHPGLSCSGRRLEFCETHLSPLVVVALGWFCSEKGERMKNISDACPFKFACGKANRWACMIGRCHVPFRRMPSSGAKSARRVGKVSSPFKSSFSS
jgi:hypothetical protein